MQSAGLYATTISHSRTTGRLVQVRDYGIIWVAGGTGEENTLLGGNYLTRAM